MLNLCRQISASLKVLSDPVAEFDRLTYIYDLVLVIMHYINSGLGRKLF